jgi:hypothetical protein
MDTELLSKLLSSSPLVAVILGLLAAIKMFRAEHAQREAIAKQTLDLLIAKNEALQAENILTLKDTLKAQTAVEARLANIEGLLKGKGG